eukprot:CAMPEP_0201595062 /NCGR_PEP_ID=MMETSP0190_2-20130828/192189_1 /ASSEMBLY_ACC=CAM_ASM_000263 /TAXON_ID=37353 /ORGANISM="Rosalina sp." /LENGTH=32 /DNA_ID= /DNA_START= /DNA_END= /DNA_ORIENTATION=
MIAMIPPAEDSIIIIPVGVSTLLVFATIDDAI